MSLHLFSVEICCRMSGNKSSNQNLKIWIFQTLNSGQGYLVIKCLIRVSKIYQTLLKKLKCWLWWLLRCLMKYFLLSKCYNEQNTEHLLTVELKMSSLGIFFSLWSAGYFLGVVENKSVVREELLLFLGLKYLSSSINRWWGSRFIF